MNVKELQTAIGTNADGMFGPASRAALDAHFSNKQAPAVKDADLTIFASRLGCTLKQIKAVSVVESAGSGFDNKGRPKILFERHLFHRLTGGKWSPSAFSNEHSGGYSEDSWMKLGMACAKDPDAAFSACSWGKFQVLGAHWSKLGYDSPYALAHSCVEDEAAHYELLVRYVLKFDLVDAMRSLSGNPEDCRAFAKGYNGPGYRKYAYHEKLAREMRR